MPYLILILLLLLPLEATKLEFIDGFAAAHTEMFGDSTIDPMSTNISADVSYDQSPDSLKGEIKVHLDTFFSDNTRRDNNMYETMQRDLYPHVSYHIISLTKTSGKLYKLKGDMQLHGVRKEVVFDVYVNETKDTFSLRGKTSIVMSHFKIKPPSLFFLTVRDQVDLTIKAQFKKKRTSSGTLQD